MSLALLLCAALQVPPAPLPPPAQPAAPGGASLGEGEGRDYAIGPEDVLRIAVYGHPDLTQSVAVQADGAFAFPLIGRVEASGLSPAQLEGKLAHRLAEGFIRAPHVAVSVEHYRSKIVFVVGEVSHPGTYPLVGTPRLVEVLAKAGPMTPSAGNEVVVVRPRSAASRPVLPEEAGDAAGGAEVIRVDLREIQAGDLGKNVALLPRDTVFVPAAPKVFVSGKVRSPGGYAFAPGTTVRQAVVLAGGSVRSAGHVQVLRSAGGRTRPVQLGLDDLVQPGDTIVVQGGRF